MRPAGRIATTILVAMFLMAAGQDRPSVESADGGRAPRLKEPPPLDMTPAVACTRVEGLDHYVVLPGARLTSEDKLKVYFRPLNYRIEPAKSRYRARFTEDGRVRRKGEKTPLSREDKLLEYEAVFDTPDYRIYLTNTIGLKNLPPGEYEFDIILHDGLVEGSSATQTLPFTIIPTPRAEPARDAEGPGGSVAPPGPAGKKVPKKGKPPRPTRPG